MSNLENNDELLNRLSLLRRTLSILLNQKQGFGLYTPPYILFQIEETRIKIQQIKEILRDHQIVVKDHFDDTETIAIDTTQNIDNNAQDPHIETSQPKETETSDKCVGHTVKLQEDIYYVSSEICELASSILHDSGYHIIESNTHTGKTLFIKYMAYLAEKSNIFIVHHSFNGDHKYSNVKRAIISIYSQLINIIRKSSGDQIKTDIESSGDQIKTDIELSIEYMINRISSNNKIILLFDSIDETDINERRLLPYLIVPIYPNGTENNNISIVTTSNIDFYTLFRKHFPTTHPIWHASPHLLSNFTLDDLEQIVAQQNRTSEIAHKIYSHTQGFPPAISYILNSINANDAQFSNSIFNPPPMKNLHGYWNKKLLAFTSINDDRNSSQLRVVLSLLSVCHTPLQIDDMCNILNIDVLQAEKIYDAMIDVFHIDSISNGHLSLPISLCDYIKGHPLYLNTCKESNKQIIEWIIGFINNTQIEVQNIPLYVLQHAAEYIANRESLRDLLARREWWNELEQRVQSPFITREVILRAWDAILQKYTQSDESTCISNIVACSIMLTTLNIMILPEWIQELAARNLWTIDQVSEYALHYFIINDGIMIIKNIVDSPKQPIKQWINPDNLIDPYIRSFMLQALEDLDLLDTLMLSPQQRSEAIYQWVQHWGIFDGSTRAREQERLKTLLSALQQTIPESEGHDPADGPRLNQLLTELQNYESPVNSIEFDPRLPNLLLEICTAWQHRRTWQSLQILSAILRPLTRYSRADLLYALELLSPALRQRLGPQAFTELSQTIEFAATHYR